ncbi:MAG: hypothetical protein AB3A66_03710 [Nodularia sp. CChRGM 3473]
MAAVRKSVVSTTGPWFQRNSTPSLKKRRSLRPESAVQGASTLGDEPAPVSANRQRRSLKKLSVATNGMQDLAKKPVSHRQEQSSTGQKNPQSGFFPFPVMSTSGAAPSWLLRLYTSHRYSSIVTFFLVATTLVVYGWTVYSQELWSQGYRRLQSLQLHERHLTTTNATLKNKMAEEAEKQAAGLVSPTPARTIFLPSASPSHSPHPTPVNTTPNPPTQQQTPSPLGY